MNERVLLVEDDSRQASRVSAYLADNGYRISVCDRGDQAEALILAQKPDLVLLGLLLPGKPGLAVCRDLRPRFSGPILILSALKDELDEIIGLELGADDYLVKPVEPRKLLARVRALLRRSTMQTEPRRQFGEFSIDHATRSARLGAQTLELTRDEFELLWLLVSQADRVLSRSELLSQLGAVGADTASRRLDSRIYRLRSKLRDDPATARRIMTLRGRGYLFAGTQGTGA